MKWLCCMFLWLGLHCPNDPPPKSVNTTPAYQIERPEKVKHELADLSTGYVRP